jgi:hypothetical protein
VRRPRDRQAETGAGRQIRRPNGALEDAVQVPERCLVRVCHLTCGRPVHHADLDLDPAAARGVLSALSTRFASAWRICADDPQESGPPCTESATALSGNHLQVIDESVRELDEVDSHERLGREAAPRASSSSSWFTSRTSSSTCSMTTPEHVDVRRSCAPDLQLEAVPDYGQWRACDVGGQPVNAQNLDRSAAADRSARRRGDRPVAGAGARQAPSGAPRSRARGDLPRRPQRAGCDPPGRQRRGPRSTAATSQGFGAFQYQRCA